MVITIGETVMFSFLVFSSLVQYLNGINPANFYKDGDYYDNLLNPLAAGPAAGQADAAILRFQPGPYSGYSLMVGWKWLLIGSAVYKYSIYTYQPQHH